MLFYQYNFVATKLDPAQNHDEWQSTPVPLEELPPGLIEDEV
jgi:hypothetical protein